MQLQGLLGRGARRHSYLRAVPYVVHASDQPFRALRHNDNRRTPRPPSSEVSRLESEVGPHAHHPLLHLRVFEQLKRRNVRSGGRNSGRKIAGRVLMTRRASMAGFCYQSLEPCDGSVTRKRG